MKQQAFKLKEDVTVYGDAAQARTLYTIQADRILDFNARYAFWDAQGVPVGAVRREGMRSLWKTHFDIFDEGGGDAPQMTFTEQNPWVKVLDDLLGEVPFVGMFTGYLFHPVYLVSRPDGTVLLRLKKEPAFFEGRFTLERSGTLDAGEETRAMLALIMMILLERARG